MSADFEEAGVRTPHSIDVERAVLASLMREDSGVAFFGDCVAAGVREEAFFRPAHRNIWTGVVGVHERGIDVDEIAVENELHGRGLLEETGGRSAINEVSESVSSTSFAESWLKQLVDLWKMRQAQRAVRALLEVVQEPAADFREVQGRMTEFLTELNGLSLEERHESPSEMAARVEKNFNAWLDGREEEIDRSREVVWGIPPLDDTFGAINPAKGEFLILLGADSGKGKSALARQVVWNNRRKGKRVATFLLETSQELWPEQAVSQQAQINLEVDAEATRLGKRGEEKIERARELMTQWRRWIDDEELLMDEVSRSSAQIAARVKQFEARTGRVDLIVVDYLQEMTAPKAGVRTDETLHQNCQELKALAKECGCPLILISAINNTYDAKFGPSENDFRGSRAISYAADVSFMMWRPEEDANGNAQKDVKDNGEPRLTFQQKIKRVKGRGRALGWTWVTFQPRYTLFWGLPKPEMRGRKPHDKELEEAEEF